MQLATVDTTIKLSDFQGAALYVTLFGKTRLNEISVEPFLHLNAFSNVENALEIIFNAF